MGKIDDAVQLILDSNGGVGLSSEECDRLAEQIKSVLCRRKQCNRCKDNEALHADNADESGDVAKLCPKCYAATFGKEPSREIAFKANSLSSMYSQVRTKYFELADPPLSYTKGVRALKRFSDDPGLVSFLTAPPSKQRKMLRDPTPPIVDQKALRATSTWVCSKLRLSSQSYSTRPLWV